MAHDNACRTQSVQYTLCRTALSWSLWPNNSFYNLHRGSSTSKDYITSTDRPSLHAPEARAAPLLVKPEILSLVKLTKPERERERAKGQFKGSKSVIITSRSKMALHFSINPFKKNRTSNHEINVSCHSYIIFWLSVYYDLLFLHLLCPCLYSVCTQNALWVSRPSDSCRLLSEPMPHPGEAARSLW